VAGSHGHNGCWTCIVYVCGGIIFIEMFRFVRYKISALSRHTFYLYCAPPRHCDVLPAYTARCVFLLSTCRPGDLWIQIDTRCRSLARSLSSLSGTQTHTHKRCVAAPGIQKQRANARSRQKSPSNSNISHKFLAQEPAPSIFRYTYLYSRESILDNSAIQC
jgi:hypothetical protein